MHKRVHVLVRVCVCESLIRLFGTFSSFVVETDKSAQYYRGNNLKIFVYYACGHSSLNFVLSVMQLLLLVFILDKVNCWRNSLYLRLWSPRKEGGCGG